MPIKILCFGSHVTPNSEAIFMPRFTDTGFAAMRLTEDSPIRELAEAARTDFQNQCVIRKPVDVIVHESRWCDKADGDRAPLLIPGHGESVKKIGDALLPIVQEFAGTELLFTTGFGPRVYLRGHVLMGHVDKYPTHTFGVSIPLFADEQWDLHLMDMSVKSDHTVHTATLNIGDLIVYEGVRMLHGRMEPYSGDHYCNIYFHYQPVEFAQAYPFLDS